MATLTQSTVRPQLDADGLALPSQVYTVASAGFAAPMGTGYATDNVAGYLLPESAPPRASIGDIQVARLAFGGATSPGSIVVAAPGAGLVNVLIGLHIGINSGSAELVNVTFPAGWMGATVFRAAATTTTAGELDLFFPGWPQTAANTGATVSISWSPTPAVGSPDVSLFYLIRPAN